MVQMCRTGGAPQGQPEHGEQQLRHLGPAHALCSVSSHDDGTVRLTPDICKQRPSTVRRCWADCDLFSAAKYYFPPDAYCLMAHSRSVRGHGITAAHASISVSEV